MRNNLRLRFRRATFITFVVALAIVAGAQATKVQFNAADQAAAAKSLLSLGDLPKPYTWQGAATAGGTQASSSSGYVCKGFNPNTSDLVITGAAATSFTAQQVQIVDHAIVMKTPQMVASVFHRDYASPKFAACLGTSLAGGAKGVSIVKAGAVTFAKEATYNAAFRVIFELHSRRTTETGILDFVALGSGRKEVTFTFTALLGANVKAKALESAGYGLALIDLNLASKLARKAL